MDSKNFKNPPAASRPAPFWSWNDNFSKDEMIRQIKDMSDKGWGSFFMHSRVGLVTPYLKEEWFDFVNACCKTAKEEGMYAHLYDEDKWPSGFAGGEVVKHKKFRQRVLCLTEKDELTEDDQILDQYDEKLIVRRILPAKLKWYNGYCYADLLNKEAVEEFLKTTHEKYVENCSEYIGNVVSTVFTDEPAYGVNRLQEYDYKNFVFLPWTDRLPEVFETEKGYDITKNLAKLFYNIEGYKKVRYDFFDIVLKMFIEAFTKPYAEWCEAHSLALTGHMMAEDTLSSQTQWIGAAMPHYEYMQRPGIDKLHRDISIEPTVKQLTSVSEQLEKERNLSEVFGCMGQQASFFHRKWIAQWQAVMGIDFVNHHLSLYSMRGERKRDFPANLFYQQPWWSEERGFSDYIGRMCEYVNSTKRNVDILFIHPIATGWCLYEAEKTINKLPKEVDFYEQSFYNLTKKLLSEKLDFHYGDETIMKKYASVDGSAVNIGKISYHTVILPPMVTLSKSTAKLLEKFAQNGGKIIYQNPHAYLIEGDNAKIEFIKSANGADKSEEVIDMLDKIYPDRIRIINKNTSQNAPGIYADHKTDGKYEYYFIISNEENRCLDTNISIKTDKYICVLDMFDGEAYDIDTVSENGRKSFDIKFYPAGSVLLRLSDKKENSAKKAYLGSGVMLKSFERIGEADIKTVSLAEDNLLVLNDAALEIGSESIPTSPLNLLQHKYFYPASDSTPFKAEYTFNVDSLPDSEISAAIEMAHNLDAITFNGKNIPIPSPNEIFDDSCYKDLSLRKVSLGTPVLGINTLIIEGKKINNITAPGCHSKVEDSKNHHPTELEAICIIGNFSVDTTDNIRFAINSPHKICPKNITESGAPFYAGNVKIKFEFENRGAKYLRIDGAEASYIRLSINGKDCGIAYWNPFIFDISSYTTEGKNKGEITLCTTLFNMTGPNRVENIEDLRGISPHTFADINNAKEDYTFIKYGIKGITLLK